jgi:hypothetical protein
MRKNLAVAVALVAFTLTAMAGEKVKKHSFKIFNNTDVNGVQLKPGDYSVAFTDGSAVFYRDGKEVAKAAARTEDAPAKFASNGLLYLSDEKTLAEIRMGGTNQKVILDGVSAKSGTSKAPSGTQN